MQITAGSDSGPGSNITTADLALFSGRPAFDEPLVVGRPNPVDKRRVLDRIDGALSRNWLTNHGPLVRELEARLAATLEVGECVTTSSCTAGLQVVAHAMGLQGEVIVPSFTFIASAHALMAAGVRPVFCDIDDKTHCLDPAAVEAAITDRTSAILGVHLWGNPAPVLALESIAERHDIRLFFDAAHALGSATVDRPLGGFGDAEVFSLHATKIVNGFEGGFIATDDDALADHVRSMCNFGFSGEDTVTSFGVNAKMSEASAAMALTSLEEIDAAMSHNAANLDAYSAYLADIAGIDVRCVQTGARHNRQYVVAEVDAAAFGLTRDELVATLRLENVMARRYFHPGCHAQEPYRSMDAAIDLRLPITEGIADRVLVLPTGRCVGERDIARLSRCIEIATSRSVAVRKALGELDHPDLAPFVRPNPRRDG